MNKQTLTDSSVEAMEALFAFSAAMDKGVTTNNLQDVMEQAIGDGLKSLQIKLTMALVAAEMADEEGK